MEISAKGWRDRMCSTLEIVEFLIVRGVKGERDNTDNFS
ncbi:hypothetical protein E2C01_053045 [Portunus trituberculatus]|uniref:Uncharacterized protein n=1 Tax=Portunus trituberculatus TaxID=210409 RepID=A0A5B7GFD7_PORTR|nr:hypothetical protein [Portunus trituberculatus]